MVDGMVAMMPNVKVGHIGLYRDPQTLEPVKYYHKMPPDISERDVIIVDPMLATGGSAAAAAMFLKEDGVKHIKLMSIIAAPEGVQRMQSEHPDVDIFVAALDDHLNDHGYIVPGLGDAATASSAQNNQAAAAGGKQGRKPCEPFLRGFFLSCQKETPQTPKAANGRWYLRCAPHCRKPFRKPGRRQMPPGAAWLRFARALTG